MVGVARVSEGIAALVLLVGGGIGLAVVDVAVRTVLQRLVPVEDLPSVFGLAEGASMGGAATGALVAGVWSPGRDRWCHRRVGPDAALVACHLPDRGAR